MGLKEILKNLEGIGVVPVIEPVVGTDSKTADIFERSIKPRMDRVTVPGQLRYRGRGSEGYRAVPTGPYRGLERAALSGSGAHEDETLPLEALCATLLTAEEPSKKEEQSFTQELTDLLKALEYPNPRIMSILPIEGRRNMVSVITFETGDGRVDQMFVKKYDGQRELEKRKDLVLPYFLKQRGVNTAVIVGYSPEEDSLPKGLGFFRFDYPLYKRLGEYDYGGFVATGMLDMQGLFNAGDSILKLMARMHIVARKEQDVLESRYGLHLEPIDYRRIVEERLVDQLEGVDPDRVRRFTRAYLAVMGHLSQGNFIVHGDSTCHNFRWCGERYEDIGVIDFELAEAGALPSYDLVTLINHTLSLREKDRKRLIQQGFQNAYRGMYFQHFHALAQDLAPGMLPGENETDYFINDLSNNLLRIGDQVMAQKNWGESDARKHRATIHLANFKVLAQDALEKAERGVPYSGELAELRDSTVALLLAANNVSYLRPVLFTR